MNKIIAIGMVAMMMFTGLVVMPDVATMEADAGETVTATAIGSGVEYYTHSTSYSDCLDGVNGSATTALNNFIASGQYWNDAGAGYLIYRGVIAFNALSIDISDATAITLNVHANFTALTIPTDGFINVYSRPATEATFNWTNFGTNMTYIGSLGVINDFEGGSWYSITVPPSALSVADWSAEYGAGIDTVFYLATSREGTAPTVLEEYIAFSYSGDTAPYLSVRTIINGEGTVDYYMLGGVVISWPILPVERMEYNATHDMFRYEVYIPQTNITELSYFHITVGSDLDYLANNTAYNHTLVNAATGEWNITLFWGNYDDGTGWMDPYYMHLWFSVPNDPATTQVNIQLWHSTLGEGFMWERFQVRYSIGTAYTNATSSRITTPSTFITSGFTYTFAVLDYFDNVITTRTQYISGSYADLLIPVNIYSVTWNSFRNDTTAISVYFNATGTPWQEHVSGGKEVKMGVREGAYMFRFDYLTSNATGFNTITETHFYNLTINSTHTINIGTEAIGIISTSISGLSITVANIETGLTSSINYAWAYPFPEVPVGGTRSPSTLTAAERTYVDYNAFQIIDGEIRLNGTGTNVSLTDARPTNGTVRWLADELYISTYPSTHIMVNDSTGNILDLTTATPLIDLTTYDLENITVWANQTISVMRSSTFRQVERIIYSTVPSTGYYYASAIVYNPSASQWRPVFWYIGYAINPVTGDSLAPDTATVELYDVNNAVTLQPGRHYNIEATAVSMMLEYLNTTISRTMTIRYYLNNGTAPLSIPILSIRSYEISTYKGETLYMGKASYTNEATATYQGGIQLSLKGLAGTINPKTLILYDVTNDRALPDEFWSYSGTTIDISSEIVGSIAVGDSQEYAIYFKYDGDVGEPFFLFDGAYSIGWLNINWHLAIFIVGLFLALLGIGDFIAGGGEGKENRKLEARGVVLLLASSFVMVIYFAIFIWHSMGAL